MKERLELLLKSEGLTSVKFAEIMNVQPSNISHIISGRNNPSYDFIIKFIERFPEINIIWLLTGNGEIYKSKNGSANQNPQELFTDVNKDVVNATIQNIAEAKPEPDKILTQINDLDNPIRFNSENINVSTNIKKVNRIIIIYSDNSFEVLDNK